MSRHRDRCGDCGRFTDGGAHECVRHRCVGCGQMMATADGHPDCTPGPQVCTVDGCDDPSDARGLCSRHYKRWHKHGDPTHVTDRDDYATRSDAATCPSIRRYGEGCRCLPCRLEWSDYLARWRAGDLEPRPTLDAAARLLEQLLDRGHDIEDVVANTTLSRSTVYRWLRGEGTHVARRAFESLEEFHTAVTTGPVVLDAQPLVDAVEASRVPLQRMFDDADLQTYYRARRSGHITDVAADRLAVAGLSMPLELIYGTDYDTQEAA